MLVGRSLKGWGWPGSVPACAGRCHVLMETESQPFSIQSQILTSPGGSAVGSFPRPLLGGDHYGAGDPRQGAQTEGLCVKAFRQDKSWPWVGTCLRLGHLAGKLDFLSWGKKAGLRSGKGIRLLSTASCPPSAQPSRGWPSAETGAPRLCFLPPWGSG